ncbi:thiamine ABC transporter substrate binding subunit [Basfia succiniciproducens]|uniref:thiamine ABC transporter substrate binding subunit n=1 Tax=Basfia succiniciproducens TaxID=653940 RepID=UPI003FCC5A39
MSKLKTFLFLTALFISDYGLSAVQPLHIYAEEYFAADWGPAPEVKAQFERAYPQCQVTIQSFDSRTTMLNRLRLEGKNTKADIVLGMDNHQLEAAEKTGLFAPAKVDFSRLSLPVEWKNTTFVPYEFSKYAFIYDKSKLTNPPESLKELVEREDLKVIYQDPRTSSIGRGLLVWMNKIYPPEQVEKAWQQLQKHTLTVGKGWSETYGTFLKGEGDLVLSNNTSPIYHLLTDQKENYAATEFSEGETLQIDFAGKIAGKHNICADEFLAFLLKPEIQNIIITKGVMLPVVEGDLEPHYAALKNAVMQGKTIDTLSVSAEQIKHWIEVWLRALSK